MVSETEQQLNIRLMDKADVPQVFDIERKSFDSSSWTIDTFYHEVEQNDFAFYFVIEYDEQIVGYVGLWIVLDNAQITTIAIDEQYRGYGLGQLLLKYVIDYVQEECEALSLEVRVDNYVAQHVYQNLGFQYGGKRKNYYGEGEDALVMWVNLNE